MAVDVKDNKLEGKFITSTGTVFDSFTIVKNAGGSKTYTVCPNELVTLKSTFPDKVNWFPSGQQTDSISFSTPVSTVVYATDLAGCIKDTFNIAVISNPNCITGIDETTKKPFLIYPSYLQSPASVLTIESSYELSPVIRLIDINGRTIMNEVIELSRGKNVLRFPSSLSSGIYFLQISTDTHENSYKFYVE